MNLPSSAIRLRLLLDNNSTDRSLSYTLSPAESIT